MQGPDRQVLADDFDRRAPFGSVLVDIVTHAMGRLDRPSWLSPDTVGSLVEDLLDRLAALTGPPLLQMYRERGDGHAVFTRHLGGDLEELRNAFPVLSDLLDRTVDQWVTVIATLLRDLDADLADVHAMLPSPGAVDSIVSGLGDPHAGGRSVCRVGFGGHAIAYKPRSLAGEAWYAELAASIASACGDEPPPGRVIDRGSHGWMTWIQGRPCTHPQMYWRRAGRTTAILWCIGAVDMHHANLVADGDHLVPIDLECIAQPDLWPQQHPPRSRPLDDSVVMTGLLPFHYSPDAPIAHHISGLYAPPLAPGGGWGHAWVHLGTDEIDRVRVPNGDVASPNAPVDGEGATVALVIDAVLRGFDEGLATLTGPHGPGDHLPVTTSRVILRPTYVYTSVLARMQAPDALADPRRFDELARSLPELAPHLRTLLGDELEAFAEVETAALRRLDVPIHHADGTDLMLDHALRLHDRVTRTGVDRHRDRIVSLRGRGRTLQTDLVRVALDQVGRPPGPPERRPRTAATSMPTRATLVAAATSLGGQLAEEGLATDHGLVWMHLDQRTPIRAHTDGAGLYSGGGGMAVAFAALAAVTGDEDWADFARRSLVPVDALPEHRWWDTGRAGEGYARLVLAGVVDDAALRDEGLALIGQALDGDPANDAPLDLLGGWGGVLASGLAALERGHDEVADSTTRLADALRRLVEDRSHDPIERRGLHRLGFAHGVTGSAWLLHRAAATLGDTRFASTADELVAAEAMRIAAHGGVPGRSTKLDGTTRAMPGWCWGVGGYALAATAPWSSRTDAVDVAVGVLADRDRTRSHLCCGEAGQLVVADQVARRFDDAVATDAARSLAASLVDLATADGPWHFYDECRHAPAGLFWGRAGIVYALARVAEPNLIPNVLTID